MSYTHLGPDPNREALDTYAQIARIARTDPARAATLRRAYSAALAAGDPQQETHVGLAIEVAFLELLFKRGALT